MVKTHGFPVKIFPRKPIHWTIVAWGSPHPHHFHVRFTISCHPYVSRIEDGEGTESMAMGETASVPVGRVGPKVDDTETISSSETVARRVEILGDGFSSGNPLEDLPSGNLT